MLTDQQRLRDKLAKQAKRAALKENRLTWEKNGIKNQILNELKNIKDFTGPCCRIEFQQGYQTGVSDSQKKIQELEGLLAARNGELAGMRHANSTR